MENDVEENSDDGEVRHDGSGVRPYRTEFAELADSRQTVEYGDGLQKHEREGGTHGIERKNPYEKRQHANVRIREKEEISETPLAGVGIPSEKHHRGNARERERDVGNEERIDWRAFEEAVSELDEMDDGKNERVRTEYLGRDVVFRSKDGEDGEGDDRESERKPSVE